MEGRVTLNDRPQRPERPIPTPDPAARERAVLVGLDLPDLHGGLAERLEELALLADTAGCDTLAAVTQARDKPDTRAYLGKGKIEEVAALAAELEATVIIVDSELTPSQARNLEEALDLRVVDRTQLILEIFSRRASTRLARDQVELAQLQYELPRFRRMWTHLSRIEGGARGGGSGTARGPGERQLEVDRRRARERIHRLRQRLQESEAQKAVATASRGSIFTVSLVGYTNVGKSTLMNALTGTELLAENRLFATLDATTRRLTVDGQELLLSDTVGFIRDLPHALVASFHATLAEVREADLLLHVVDIASPELDEQIAAVRAVLTEIEAHEQPTLMVFNKLDALDPGLDPEGIATRHGGGLLVSAQTGEGLDALRAELAGRARAEHGPVELLIPYSDARAAAQAEARGQVQSREYEDGGVRLVVVLPAEDRARLADYVVQPG